MANDNHIARTGQPVHIIYREKVGDSTQNYFSDINEDATGTVTVYECGTVKYTDGLDVRIIPGGIIEEIKFTKAEAALPRIVR